MVVHEIPLCTCKLCRGPAVFCLELSALGMGKGQTKQTKIGALAAPKRPKIAICQKECATESFTRSLCRVTGGGGVCAFKVTRMGSLRSSWKTESIRKDILIGWSNYRHSNSQYFSRLLLFHSSNATYSR